MADCFRKCILADLLINLRTSHSPNGFIGLEERLPQFFESCGATSFLRWLHPQICVFFCNVGSYHFVGAYAGATACLRGHSGSLRGQKLLEICLRGLRACGFVQEVPTRLQSRRFF